MHLTAKIKVNPTEEQLKVLWDISDKCCSLYNLALAERKDAWKLEHRTVSYVDQQNRLPEFKKNNPEYKAVYSKTLQGILKKLDANYRSSQNQGYLSRFIEFLAYKAELAGKRVIKIDESYTSKTCYVCGQMHNMPIWKRTMECDCGNYIDRDRNSAINIMLNFLSQNALWTGCQQFVDNLRQTGLLMPTRSSGLHLQMM